MPLLSPFLSRRSAGKKLALQLGVDMVLQSRPLLRPRALLPAQSKQAGRPSFGGRILSRCPVSQGSAGSPGSGQDPLNADSKLFLEKLANLEIKLNVMQATMATSQATMAADLDRLMKAVEELEDKLEKQSKKLEDKLEKVEDKVDATGLLVAGLVSSVKLLTTGLSEVRARQVKDSEFIRMILYTIAWALAIFLFADQANLFK